MTQTQRRKLAITTFVVLPACASSGAAFSGEITKWNDPKTKAQVAIGLSPKWPVGRAANGNDGVAKA